VKKLFLGLALGAAALYAWQHSSRAKFADGGSASFADEDSSADRQPGPESPPERGAPEFKCDGRQYCSQMTSFAEARFFLDHCPDVKMDGDHDGVPCERQFDR
jgi:hypothetical protein